MALTVTDVLTTSNIEGTDKGLRIVDITFDNSYLADGEAITPAELQLSTIDVFIADVKQAATLLDNEVFYDYANGKLVAVVGSTGVEVANAVDLSGVTVRALVIGTKEA
jgi:hypothetical protein